MDNAQIGYCSVEKTGKIKKNTIFKLFLACKKSNEEKERKT